MTVRFGARWGALLVVSALVALAAVPAQSVAQTATGSCEKQVAFALVDARTDGCLTGTAGEGKWVTSDAVRLNGVPIPVAPGTQLVLEAPSAGAPGGKITVTTAPITLAGVTLQPRLISQNLPAGGNGNEADFAAFQPAGNQNLFGIAVKGRVGIKLGKDANGTGYSKTTLVLELPSALKNGPNRNAGGLTGVVAVRADFTGVKTDQLKIEVRNAYIGQIEVRNFCLSYTAGGSSNTPCSPPAFGASPLLTCPAASNVNRWDGSALMTLPTASRPRLGLWAGIGGGQFSYAGASVTNLGTSVVLAPAVFLDKFGLGVCVNPPPFQIKGAAGIRFGPVIGGTSIAYLDSSLHYIDSRPWVMRTDGSLNLFGQNLARGFLKFQGNGAVDFGFQASLSFARGLLSVTSSVVGWYQPEGRRFDVFGNGRVCVARVACASGEVAVSSVGVAGCVDLGNIRYPKYVRFLKFRWAHVRIRAGAGYRWGQRVRVMGGSCGVGGYRARKAAFIAQAGETRTIDVPSGPGVAIQVKGEGAPPKVELVSPDGRRVIRADQEGAIKINDYEYAQDPEDNSTNIEIVTPEAGAWTLRALPGSSTVTEDSTAPVEVPADAVGEVQGEGYHRKLVYSWERAGSNQEIQFVERGTINGESYEKVLGMAGGDAAECPSAPDNQIPPTPAGDMPAKPTVTCGAIDFNPAIGPAGERKIVGVVMTDGEPTGEIPVATYTAPPPKDLPEPADVTIDRNPNGEVTVGWKPVQGAETYTIQVELSDGESLVETASAGQDKFTLPDGVAPGDTIIARVAAVRRDDVAGSYREATFKGIAADPVLPESPSL